MKYLFIFQFFQKKWCKKEQVTIVYWVLCRDYLKGVVQKSNFLANTLSPPLSNPFPSSKIPHRER